MYNNRFVRLTVVVVVGTKIARPCVCARCKRNQLVNILVCTRFELLKKAYWR